MNDKVEPLIATGPNTVWLVNANGFEYRSQIVWFQDLPSIRTFRFVSTSSFENDSSAPLLSYELKIHFHDSNPDSPEFDPVASGKYEMPSDKVSVSLAYRNRGGGGGTMVVTGGHIEFRALDVYGDKYYVGHFDVTVGQANFRITSEFWIVVPT
jgi:hypothetical protein